jgi:hypothetical protein
VIRNAESGIAGNSYPDKILSLTNSNGVKEEEDYF